jgi:pilus assembly protein CpaB
MDQENAKDGKPIPSTVVTLLVSPEDGERIALAASEGQVMLTLRNPLDKSQTMTSGTRTATLLGEPTVAVPAAPRAPRASAPPKAVQPEPTAAAAPKIYTVEAIRGAKRSEEIVR